MDLTPSQVEKLEKFAQREGFTHIDIYWRERLRHALDSVDGLALRFQYLGSKLSDAEQAAFFGRWGVDLQNLITRSFDNVEKRLARVEFNQERDRPIRHIAFQFDLDSEITPDTHPNFRAMLLVCPPSAQPYREIHLAIVDGDGKQSCGPDRGTSIAGKFWVDDISKIISTSATVRPKSQNRLYASSGFSEIGDPALQLSLDDLDENWIVFFASRSLADKIQRIELHCNSYRLWTADRPDLRFDTPNDDVEWPWEMTEEELANEWVRILPNSIVLRFDEYVPETLWTR